MIANKDLCSSLDVNCSSQSQCRVPIIFYLKFKYNYCLVLHNVLLIVIIRIVNYLTLVNTPNQRKG